MVLSEAQAMSINSRNGLVNVIKRWPKVIPYVMEHHTWAEQKYIRKALDHLEMLSCLKFVPRTYEEDYVDITNEDLGCFAYVGRSPGRNQLNIAPGWNGVIGDGCMLTSVIHHEMLHTLGFYHMQSSWDRDYYIDIQWDNISEGSHTQFEMFNHTIVSHFDIPYDYRSVMHYPKISNAIDWEKPTIITKDPAYQDIIGQNAGMSRRDIERLNRMYECPL
ncbi:zinc metalloproteinase nas-8-like [Culicoides brevitarsis]|uniref:zinc metalloproteinase nas-8-like n=1 Tax=Culicoides brevitarsis TaxID=469753 RepID=UPI00307C3A00